MESDRDLTPDEEIQICRKLENFLGIIRQATREAEQWLLEHAREQEIQRLEQWFKI